MLLSSHTPLGQSTSSLHSTTPHSHHSRHISHIWHSTSIMHPIGIVHIPYDPQIAHAGHSLSNVHGVTVVSQIPSALQISLPRQSAAVVHATGGSQFPSGVQTYHVGH